jgi:putative AdoMet-dependent methyltransferase
MNEVHKWLFDERKHHGVDYADYGVVARYDEQHTRFRDYQKSAKDIINALGLGPEQTVIDMGCGTGAFVLHAAQCCKIVYAVDISEAMLEYLKTKASRLNLNNIKYHQAGFLTYNHTDEPVDAVVSVAVLHHLPDFWKLIGLNRVADMLRPGGRMCFFDVVFSFDAREHQNIFNQWISSTKEKMGEEFANELVTHIRDEYSTWDWILEGMLEKCGFLVNEKKALGTMPGTTYICTKKEILTSG